MTCAPSRERPRRPPSPRQPAPCSSRVSASSRPTPFRHASTPASPASKRTTAPRSPTSATGRPSSAGIALGEAAATAIRRLRAEGPPDRTAGPRPRLRPGHRARRVPLHARHPVAFGPRLGEAVPFVLNAGSQFRPGPPHAVTDRRYTADFNEIKRLGSDGVSAPSARTPDQTQIALFWIESSPLQWNRIARTASARTGLDAWEEARLFALLNLALTDGYIGTFETKYHYDYWRPVTAIRLAATDGNRDTSADPAWTPLRETPPIPDYDSGHAVQGATAAAVLQRFFGTDRLSSAPAARRCPWVVAATMPRPRKDVLGLRAGVGGERALTHPRRVPLPRGGGGGHRPRCQDRAPDRVRNRCAMATTTPEVRNRRRHRALHRSR